MKISALITPKTPCPDCGGIERFPRNLKCIACTRKDNGIKMSVKLREINFHTGNVQAINQEREFIAMQGIWYD